MLTARLLDSTSEDCDVELSAIPVRVSSVASESVRVEIKEEKTLSDELDLDEAIKVELGDLTNPKYLGLSTSTRTDIRDGLQVELNALREIPVEHLIHALRFIILRNPELSQQARPGNSCDVFVINKRDYDKFCFHTASATVATPAVIYGLISDCPLDLLCCCFGNPLAIKCWSATCLLAACTSTCWATGRPAAITCQSRESSTRKTFKLLTPVILSITVALLMYRFFSESLGDTARDRNMDPLVGSLGGPLLIGWATYLLTSCLGISAICSDRKDKDSMLASYMREHSIPREHMISVLEGSSIEKLLVEYKREGDSNPLVREFSRDVLNHWIEKLESVQRQERIVKGEKEEKLTFRV